MFRGFLFAAVFLFGFTTMSAIIGDIFDVKGFSLLQSLVAVLTMAVISGIVAAFTVKDFDDITKDKDQ